MATKKRKAKNARQPKKKPTQKPAEIAETDAPEAEETEEVEVVEAAPTEAEVVEEAAEAVAPEAVETKSKTALIHGRFNPLEVKLAMVRNYPGVTGEMIDAAIKEAQDRIARFEEASPEMDLLNIVVSVYLDGASSTLVYVLPHVKEAFGVESLSLGPTYIGEIDESRIRYLQGSDGEIIVPVFRDCVRIEVVDLGAHFRQENKLEVEEVRGSNSAHFACIYAAIQDPVWANLMDGESAPRIHVCGLQLEKRRNNGWVLSPTMSCYKDKLRLGENRLKDQVYLSSGSEHSNTQDVSMPTLWS